MQSEYRYSIHHLIEYQNRMIREQQPGFLIPYQIVEDSLVYDLSGKKPLSELLRMDVAENMIRSWIREEEVIRSQMEDLFLDDHRLIHDPDYWFYDAITEKWSGIYIPDEAFSDPVTGTAELAMTGWLHQAIDRGTYEDQEILRILQLLRNYRSGILEQDPEVSEEKTEDTTVVGALVLQNGYTEPMKMSFYQKVKNWFSLRFL